MPIPLPLLPLIAETIYYSSRPSMDLDPVPEPGRWTEKDARQTLHALSQVNKDWHDEAGKYLWRRLHFRLAGGFLSVVDVVAGKQDEHVRNQTYHHQRIRPEIILPDGPSTSRFSRTPSTSLRITSIPESSNEDDDQQQRKLTSIDTNTNAFAPRSFSNESSPSQSPQTSSPLTSPPSQLPSIASIFSHPVSSNSSPPSSRKVSPNRGRGRRRLDDGVQKFKHNKSSTSLVRARSMSPISRDVSIERRKSIKNSTSNSSTITSNKNIEIRGRKFDRIRELSVDSTRLRSASPTSAKLKESHYNAIAVREPSPERQRLAEVREQSPDENDNNLWFDPFCPVTGTPYPARHINHISFSSFRTAGLRRSIAQGTDERFCTPDRLERLLDACRAVRGFGASEYMDSALSLPVLESLLLREPPPPTKTRLRRAHSVRDPPTFIHHNHEDETSHCRKVVPGRQLHALDFSGCVSQMFFDSLEAFVNRYLFVKNSNKYDENDEFDNESSNFNNLTINDNNNNNNNNNNYNPHTGRFTALRRLNVSNLVNVYSPTLKTFVLAFPSLTHLDLSNTRATPGLIKSLSQSSTIRLESFSSARCKKLDGDCLLKLLVESPVTENLKELNLYGDSAVPSPLNSDELEILLLKSPCFLLGNMRYIDIAGSPLNNEMLEKMTPQPHLRSLGLANIPRISLNSISNFIKYKAPGCEIVDIALSTPELTVIPGVSSTVRSAVLALQTNFIKVLTNPPFHFSLTSPIPAEERPPPTAIRVVELGAEMLNALQGGAGSWRVIRSRGRRGWYVDVSTKPLSDGLLARNLDRNDPWRQQMEGLSQARGNVASYVGWHSRKMEVLSGQGMLGREDGLYGVYAYSTGL